MRKSVRIRTCTACHHSEFVNLMDKYSTRSYRHAPEWANRCEFFRQNPEATFGSLGIPMEQVKP